MAETSGEGPQAVQTGPLDGRMTGALFGSFTTRRAGGARGAQNPAMIRFQSWRMAERLLMQPGKNYLIGNL